MHIGLYVTTLRPSGASQARFQNSILRGLEDFASNKYCFHVFSHDVSLPPNNDALRYHTLRESIQPSRAVRAAKRITSTPLASLLWRTGHRTAAASVTKWASVQEPSHFAQLKEANIRLLWNINQHELPSPVPYVRTIWDVNHRIYSYFPEYSYTRYTFSGLDREMQTSLDRASYVVTGTDVGRRELIEIYGVSERKIRVLPFPTPMLPVPKDNTELMEPGSFIFYPARFWPHKNHVVILEALKILRFRYGWSLKCIFSGDDEGNLNYILRYAERIGVADLIDYEGKVSEERLVQLYTRAFALVYASMVGPDNLPPLEAMALECPVLTADVPGAREQFGDAVVLFPPSDENALAKRLIELRDNTTFRQRLVSKATARAAAYTPKDYARRMVGILDEFSLLARNWERGDSAFT